jgi:lysophospholipase L1-like esterase
LYLLCDSVYAIEYKSGGREEKALAWFCAIWIVAVLGAWLLGRSRFVERTSNVVFGMSVTLLLLCLFEVGIRVNAKLFDHRVLFFKSNTKQVYDLTPWYMPGTSPHITLTTNSMGLRGPLPPQRENVYKIIAIGGSTTQCAALDDSQVWTQILMDEMNDAQSRYAVWVGNAGVSGATTVDHLSCLRERQVLRQADMLIFLIGINDLQAALNFDGVSTQAALEERANSFLQHVPSGVTTSRGILRRSWLLAMARTGVGELLNPPAQTQAMNIKGHLQSVSMQSRQRALGPTVPLPDLSIGLAEYANRIQQLENECRQRNLRCIFLTQPTIWRSGLSLSEQRLLWFGGVGHAGEIFGYVSIEDLQHAMDAYNGALMKVCDHDHLECFDLAAGIPKGTSAFYDDVHLNIGGARMVGDLLAKRLLAAAPFAEKPNETQAASRAVNHAATR